MKKSKIVVADTKESFIQAVDKALSQGYLPLEEYVMNGAYYIGKFVLSSDNTYSVSIEAAMKAIDQPMIIVNRQPVVRNPAKTTRKRKVER